MSIPLPFRKRAERNQARQDWIEERLREARIVVADVTSHSDHMLRLACNVLVRHSETPAEREDARLLLVVLDARAPARANRNRPDPEDQP